MSEWSLFNHWLAPFGGWTGIRGQYPDFLLKYIGMLSLVPMRQIAARRLIMAAAAMITGTSRCRQKTRSKFPGKRYSGMPGHRRR